MSAYETMSLWPTDRLSSLNGKHYDECEVFYTLISFRRKKVGINKLCAIDFVKLREKS